MMRRILSAGVAAAASAVLAAPSAQAVTGVNRSFQDPAGDVTHCRAGTTAEKHAADLLTFRVRLDPAHTKVVGLNLVLSDLAPKASAQQGHYSILLADGNYIVIQVGAGGALSVFDDWPDYTGGYGETRLHPASATYNGVSDAIHVSIPLRGTIKRVDSWVGNTHFCSDAVPRLSLRVRTA